MTSDYWELLDDGEELQSAKSAILAQDKKSRYKWQRWEQLLHLCVAFTSVKSRKDVKTFNLAIISFTLTIYLSVLSECSASVHVRKGNNVTYQFDCLLPEFAGI